MTDTQEPVAWAEKSRLQNLVGMDHVLLDKEGGGSFDTALFTQDQLDAAVRAERERCARVADDTADAADFLSEDSDGWRIAAAIREGE